MTKGFSVQKNCETVMLKTLMSSLRTSSHIMVFICVISLGNEFMEATVGAKAWKAAGALAILLYCVTAIFDEESFFGQIIYYQVRNIRDFIYGCADAIAQMWISITNWDWLIGEENQHSSYGVGSYYNGKTIYKDRSKYNNLDKPKPKYNFDKIEKVEQPWGESKSNKPAVPKKIPTKVAVEVPLISGDKKPPEKVKSKSTPKRSGAIIQWRTKPSSCADPIVGDAQVRCTDTEIAKTWNLNLADYPLGYKIIFADSLSPDSWTNSWIRTNTTLQPEPTKYDYYLIDPTKSKITQKQPPEAPVVVSAEWGLNPGLQPVVNVPVVVVEEPVVVVEEPVVVGEVQQNLTSLLTQ